MNQHEQKFVKKKYLTDTVSLCMISKVITDGKVCTADAAL